VGVVLRHEALREEEAVDGVLCPVGRELGHVHLVALLKEVVDDEVDVGLCLVCFVDFISVEIPILEFSHCKMLIYSGLLGRMHMPEQSHPHFQH